MSHRVLISAFLIFPFLPGLVQASTQCISVRGRVKCPEDRELRTPVIIRMADEDTARPDDRMDEGYASGSGVFEMYGCATDPFGTTIDPILKIYHKCKGTAKKIVLKVPKDYVGKEYIYPRTINLADYFQDETNHDYHLPKCSAVKPHSFFLF